VTSKPWSELWREPEQGPVRVSRVTPEASPRPLPAHLWGLPCRKCKLPVLDGQWWRMVGGQFGGPRVGHTACK
jgi:hypothetical protein